MSIFQANIFHTCNEFSITAVPFKNGKIKNKKSENQGSAILFSFGLVKELSEKATLELFGEHHDSVLENPDGKDHQNIRQFMKTGFAGLKFPKGTSALKARPIQLSHVVQYLWGQKESIKAGSKFECRKEIIQIFECIEAGHLGPVAVDMISLGKAETLKQAQACCEVFPWVKQGLLIGLPKLFKKRVVWDRYHDTLPTKDFTWKQFEKLKISKIGPRIVIGGIRRGSFTPDPACMPNFWINSGAHVGKGVMADASSTIGSCAYVGKNIHISGKAGVGGVFEPFGDVPTVVGDDAFIGLGSEPAEGVIIGPRAVMATGVIITGSTRIYDNRPGSPTEGKHWHGFVPHDSLAVNGTYPRKGGSVSCVRLVKNIDPDKRSKVEINEALRNL